MNEPRGRNGSGSDALDYTPEDATRVRINPDIDRAADMHVADIGLLHIGKHPHIVRIVHHENWLTALDHLPKLDTLTTDHPVDRAMNDGILQA